MMNIYKNKINRFPDFQRKNNIRFSKRNDSQKENRTVLDNFVGRYEAFEPINCVDLKNQFKKAVI